MSLRWGILQQSSLSFPVSGLTNYWRFDETSGTIAYDSKGPSNLTVSNATFTASGKHNYAASIVNSNGEFYGSQYVNNYEYTNSFSFSFWYYTVNNVTRRLVSKQDTTYKGYVILITNNMLYFEIYGGANGLTMLVTSNFTADTNYHHLVFTYDGSNNANGMKIYVDGVLSSTINTNQPMSASILSTANFIVGNWFNLNSPAAGYIDEFGSWNRTLTQKEITDLYNNNSGLFY